MEQVFHAISFGQQLSLIKSIDVNLRRRGLIAYQKMSWHSYPSNRKVQPACNQEIDQAKGDGISCPAIQHAIQVAIVRLVVILFVAMKLELAEKVLIDRGQQSFGSCVEIDAL